MTVVRVYKLTRSVAKSTTSRKMSSVFFNFMQKLVPAGQKYMKQYDEWEYAQNTQHIHQTVDVWGDTRDKFILIATHRLSNK